MRQSILALTKFWPRSRRVFGWRDCRDLGKILARSLNLGSCQKLAEILGEISKSRWLKTRRDSQWDLDEISRSHRDSGRDSYQDLSEISNLGGQKLAEILAKILTEILTKISMFTSQLATFNERKIAIAETRHTGELTVILGSSRPLLWANKNYSPADVLNLSASKNRRKFV